MPGGRAAGESSQSGSVPSAAFPLPCPDLPGGASSLLVGRACPVPISHRFQVVTSRGCPEWGKEGEALREAGQFSNHGGGTQQPVQGSGRRLRAPSPGVRGAVRGHKRHGARPGPGWNRGPFSLLGVWGLSCGTAGPGRERGGQAKSKARSGHLTPGPEQPPAPPPQAPAQERQVRVTQSIKRHLFTVTT